MTANDSQYQSSIDRLIGQFKLDWHAGFLVAVMLLIQFAGLGIVTWITNLSMEMPAQSTNLTVGGQIIAVVIVESLVLAGLWVAYRRLSDWWQKVVKYLIAGAVLAPILYVCWVAGVLVEYIAVAAVTYGAITAIKHLQLIWLVHNALAVLLGIYVVVAAGIQLSPAVVLVVMGAAMVWDYLAVDLSWIMNALIEFSSSASIPNYMVVPNAARIDMSAVRDWITADDAERGESPNGVAGVIGLGDFIIPSALPVATAVALGGAWLTGPVIGAVAGTCGAILVLRRALERRDTAVPALPWLNTGAIVGYSFGILVSGVPVMAALGVLN